MKRSYRNPVSNNRWKTAVIVSGFSLFFVFEVNAELIRTPHIYHPCLEMVLEAAKVRPIPLPEPHPLPIGCLSPGCELTVSEPLELIIELGGDLKPLAQLKIDGLSADKLRMLKISKEVQRVPDQQNTFLLGVGKPRISGLSMDLRKRMRIEEIVDTVMRPAVDPLIPTLKLHLSIDERELKKAVSHNDHVNAQKPLSKITVNLKVVQGETTINEASTVYTFIHCWDIPVPEGSVPVSPPFDKDQVHVTKQSGGVSENFAEEAVVFANGRIKTASSVQWQGPEAYKGKSFFWMRDGAGGLVDLIDTSTECATVPDKCSEVAVFARDHAMTMSTLPRASDPTKDWSSIFGETVEVPINPSAPLNIPVEFYILWEHANGDLQNARTSDSSCPTGSNSNGPTTDCLADWWLREANALWGNMWSGIQFVKQTPVITHYATNLENAGCDDKSTVYSHFGLNPNSQPRVRVFFVRESTETNGNGHDYWANGWTCPGARNPPEDTFNNIFISTAHANSTTLAHEFGHTLSLWDTGVTEVPPCPSGSSCPPPVNTAEPWVSDPDGVYPSLTTTNLMWSGSTDRNGITKAQSFRANANRLSAVHRHLLQTGSLAGSPRECSDEVPPELPNTCPAIYVDK